MLVLAHAFCFIGICTAWPTGLLYKDSKAKLFINCGNLEALIKAATSSVPYSCLPHPIGEIPSLEFIQEVLADNPTLGPKILKILDIKEPNGLEEIILTEQIHLNSKLLPGEKITKCKDGLVYSPSLNLCISKEELLKTNQDEDTFSEMDEVSFNFLPKCQYPLTYDAKKMSCVMNKAENNEVNKNDLNSLVQQNESSYGELSKEQEKNADLIVPTNSKSKCGQGMVFVSEIGICLPANNCYPYPNCSLQPTRPPE